jgi:hypothetical protein
VLDSAGCGPFTITKSVIINAPQGVIGGYRCFQAMGLALTQGRFLQALKRTSAQSQGHLGIRDGRRPTDQTIILDREWLARRRAVRWTEISDGITPSLC